MDLDTLLGHLKAFAEKGKLLDALKGDPDLKNALYQPAFNDGHAVATGAHTGAKTAMENKLKAAEEAKAAAEKALKDLKENNPDAAKIHQEYEQKITALQGQIDTLKTTHLEEKKTDKRGSLRAAVEAELLALRVDPDKAKAMADAHAEQYQVGDDLAERILQPGQSIAYSGDRTAQVKAFAADLFKTVPKTLIRSQVPGGGSAGEGGSTAGAGTDEGDKRSALQRQKEAAQNKFKKPAAGTSGNEPLDPQQEVNRRLGRRVLT